MAPVDLARGLRRRRTQWRWWQFRHPWTARLFAVALPVLACVAALAWPREGIDGPKLRAVLDTTLYPLDDLRSRVASLVHGGADANAHATGRAATVLRGGRQAPAPAAFRRCDGAARRDCVLDGDTIRLDGRRIRLADIDAPETFSPRCAAELALGERATLRLLDLMNQGPIALVPLPDRDTDGYGRLLRIVQRDGRSLGDMLVQEGLARRWDGARRGWC